MTSKRAAEANRRNARRSTGPRTAKGKARSRLNAQSHGLAAQDPNPGHDVAVEQLAGLLVGEQTGDAVFLQAARHFAEAELHMRRVRSVKLQLVRDYSARVSSASDNTGTDNPMEPADIPCAVELLEALEKIERYERRAFSRRKQAARALSLSQHN